MLPHGDDPLEKRQLEVAVPDLWVDRPDHDNAAVAP